MASQQAIGESLRMSNTSGSACPGNTMRADAQWILGCALALVVVNEHKP